jgi:hypothetical protein
MSKIRPNRPLLVAASAMTLLPIASGMASASTQPVTGNSPPGQITISDPVPAGFDSWNTFIQVQNNLDETADAVHGLAEQSGVTGFGSIVVDQADRQLKLYWKGAPPAQVAAIAAGMPTGYSIQSLPALYDDDALSADVQRVAQTFMSDNIAFTSVAPEADSSGIEVDVPGDPGPATAALKDSPVAAHVVTSDQRFTATGISPGPGEPVPVGGPSGPLTNLTGRLDDSPLYSAGARWYAYTETSATPVDMCTTGFAVQQDGKNMLLTAGHCLGNGAEVFTKTQNGAFSHEGFLEQDLLGPGVTGHDFALINLGTSGSQGRVWFGGADPLTDYEWPVAKAEYVDVGDEVCTDGATSLKMHCGGKVLNVGATTIDQDGMITAGMAEARSTDGTPLTVRGDSGGPVLFPDGINGLIPQGIISQAGWNSTYGYGIGFPTVVDAEKLYHATTLSTWP